MAEETIKLWGDPKNPTKYIGAGKGIPHVDGFERVTGKAVYASDPVLPHLLFAATLRSPHPNAMVKKVDLSKAREMPGVRAVLSDADPEAHSIEWYTAQGPNRETPGKPVSRLFDSHCRYAGDEIAVVAAETQLQAWDAVRAIKVEYEVLPFVVDGQEALKPDAVKVWEAGNLLAPPTVYKRGDIDKGFAEAEVVVEETYETSTEIHSILETHGSTSQWDGDKVTVWDSTQGVFGMQPAIAAALKLPMSNVRVIGKYMGGGFGSKLEAGKYSVMAALLSKKAGGRPVKLFLSREEGYLAVGNRPKNWFKIKIGAKKDGTLTAMDTTCVGEIGAYPAGNSSVGNQQVLWKCPNVRTTETNVYINAGRNRPMRGPGFSQSCWCLDQAMDLLATKLGMDPVELRLKNFTEIDQETGRQYTSTGIAEGLRRGSEAFGWKAARSRPAGNGPILRGVGVACSTYHGGPGSATAILKVLPDGTANLNMGAADLGVGMKTIAALLVKEELGIPTEKIQIEWADTATTQYTRPSGGSKTVYCDGPPIRRAAMEVKRILLEWASAQLKVPVAGLDVQDGMIVAPGGKKMPFSELTRMRAEQSVVGLGRFELPDLHGKALQPFLTHFAEIEVNTGTGVVKVLRFLGAQDAGKVMNLMTYQNQLFGGMFFGMGFALYERRVMDQFSGKMLNANFHDYKIPTCMETPEMTCLPIDMHDVDSNIIGTKGIGEPCNFGFPAAIANAFYHATGVQCPASPMTPARVLAALEKRPARGTRG